MPETTLLLQLFKTGKVFTRSKDELIHSYNEDNTICFIESGYIERYIISNDGSINVNGLYGPNNFLPLALVLKTLLGQTIYRGNEDYYYQAITKVKYYALDPDRLIQAAHNDANIYKEVLFEASKRLQSNIQQLENISQKNSLRRVAHELVYLAREFGSGPDSKRLIDIPLSQQDIANILSLTRETTSRALVRLKDLNIISSKEFHFTVDINKLISIYS